MRFLPSSFALVQNQAVCQRLAELKCDYYSYAPITASTEGEKQECFSVDGSNECMQVKLFAYDTSHLRRDENAAAFEPGGAYNFPI